MAKSIEDLLNALKSPNQTDFNKFYLPNNKETWRRIGEKDSFAELGMESSELDEFLKDWMANNPYSNI